MVILLLTTAFLYGCSQTGNVAVEKKNLTVEEAADLAMNRVCELTKNKEAIDNDGMKLFNSTYEGDKDRWLLFIQASHTLIKTYVYNNGTVKVMQTTLE